MIADDVNPRARAMLEAIVTGETPYPPMWETVPVRFVGARRGQVTMETTADARHINALGTVHGGFAATVLDTVLGLTIYTAIAEHERHATVDLAVKIVKRIPLGTPLIVSADLVHVSAAIGVSQGTLRDAAGTVYAHGTTTCVVQPRRD